MNYSSESSTMLSTDTHKSLPHHHHHHHHHLPPATSSRAPTTTTTGTGAAIHASLTGAHQFVVPHPHSLPHHHHHVHQQQQQQQQSQPQQQAQAGSSSRDRDRERGYKDREREREREPLNGSTNPDGLLANPSTHAQSNGRKRAKTAPLDEASFLPSNDRNEWYYPMARPSADDDDVRDFELPPGTHNGNWGNKHARGSRWVRRGKIVAWGPAKAEWDQEERARTRLRKLLPPLPQSSRGRRRRRSPSPPPTPTLPHLRSPTPPLTAAILAAPSVHPNFTSFVLSPAVQHAFTAANLLELEGTATELIAGEGALRKAFGGLWRALEGDLAKHARVDDEDGDDEEEDGDEDRPSKREKRDRDRGMDEEEGPDVPPLHRLFITPAPISLPNTDPRAVLAPQSQVESLDWALGVLRELADDGREYTGRLEEIRDGLGKAGEVRTVVWKAVREEAIGEMEGRR